jgi:hypothetical protein
MIRAPCHTADSALSLGFDATPWFREADHQSILHLADQDWSSVWVADALETRPGYEGLHQLVHYAATRLREEPLEDPIERSTLLCQSRQPSGIPPGMARPRD